MVGGYLDWSRGTAEWWGITQIKVNQPINTHC